MLLFLSTGIIVECNVVVVVVFLMASGESWSRNRCTSRPLILNWMFRGHPKDGNVFPGCYRLCFPHNFQASKLSVSF